MVQEFRRLGFAGLALLALMANRAPGGFTVVDLGVVSTTAAVGPSGVRFPNSGANGINAGGATVGSEQDAPSSQSAVMASGGSRFQQVAPPLATTMSSASAINVGGSIAGSFVDPVDNQTHAFVNIGGRSIDLGTLATGRSASATGINASNQVVGSGAQADFSERAFRIDAGSGAITKIQPLAGGTSNYGNGINDAGWVVGTSGVGSGYVHAFVYDGTNTIDLTSGKQNSAFGANSQGMAINNNDYAAGFADVGSYEHAFIASVGGPMIDIGVGGGYTSSYAYALNDLQQVVGTEDRGGSSSTAFAYAPTTGTLSPIDLNSLLDPADQLAWHLVSATGINDSDEICGEGMIGGVMHGFLLEPDSIGTAFRPFASVPAPPAAILSGLGLAIAAGWSRLRRGRTGGRATS